MVTPTITNLTPHKVVIMDDDQRVIAEYPTAAQAARVKLDTKLVGYIGKTPLTYSHVLSVDGLPDEDTDHMYIVSQFIKATLRTRNDLLVPAGTVRNSNGRVIGCRSLGI
jgi:hypothetical protein